MKNRIVPKFAFQLLSTSFLLVRPVAAREIPPTNTIALERTVGDVAFSPDLHWLAVGQTDGQVAVWDLTQGNHAGSWVGQGRVAFISNSNELLLAEGTNLAVRDLNTGQVLRRLESPTTSLNSLAVSRSGNVAVAAIGTPSQLVFWNLADGKLITQLPTTRYPWELGPRSGNRPSGTSRLPISMSAGFCQALSPDGARFAAGHERGQVDVWNLVGNNDNHYLGTVSGPNRSAEAMAFLDNRRLAVAYDREQLAVLSLNPNSTDATAQFKTSGLENGRGIEGREGIATLESSVSASQETLKQHPDRSLLQKRQTLIGKPGLEIRSLAVSGDGRRLAVAGMRMAWRPGFFVPAGDGTYDAPVNAELQIWDAVEMKLLVTIKGRPDEKFAQVALDETGGRVATVTTGVTYNSTMPRAQQQGLERSPTSTRRVYVWRLPSD